MSSRNAARAVVYGTPSCSDCHLAQRVLDALGVDYTWVDLAEQPEQVAVALELNGGRTKVPTIHLPGYGVLVEPGKEELEEAVQRWRRSGP